MAEKISSKKLITFRIVTAVLILACGEGLRRYLASFKKAPAKNELSEKTYTVKALTVKKAQHLIHLEGYGVINSGETVNVSTEISGIVSYVNPRLEKGLSIDKGETLFKIQEDDYKLGVERDKSRISTLKAQIDELKTDIEFSAKNLELQQQQAYLAKKDLDRQKELLKKGIGTKVTKDTTERAYLSAETAILTGKQRIAASKAKINILENQIKEAEVSMKLNLNNLKKCEIKAPARLRVTAKYVEVGQLATPGTKMLVMEDDSKLEIPVMISGPEVVRWLKLQDKQKNLFESLTESPADIFWTESKNKTVLAKGSLTRIEDYDSANRMVKGLVQIDELLGVAAPGMFCKVRIAGKKLKDVYKIPRVSLNQKNELMLIDEGRLKFVKVESVYDSGDFIYIKAEPLPEAITVLDNKLANPIEGLKVQLEEQ